MVCFTHNVSLQFRANLFRDAQYYISFYFVNIKKPLSLLKITVLNEETHFYILYIIDSE